MNYAKYTNGGFMNAYFKKYFVLSALALISPICAQETITTPAPDNVIILDINDVVAKASKITIAKQSLSPSLVGYLLCNFGTPKKSTFAFLTQEFGEQRPLNPNDPQDQWRFVLGDGDSKLPQIMVDHKAGRLTSQEVIDKAHARIDNPTKYVFSGYFEKQAVKELIDIIFHPTLVVENTYPIDEAITLFKTCTERTNTQIMILSNFPKDTFEVFYKQPMTQKWFKELNIKPENIIISGRLGTTKPDVAIYNHAIKRLEELNPKFKDKEYLKQHALFIDDKECNIKGAQASGLTGIVCDGVYSKIQAQLEKQGFLGLRSKL